MQRIGLAALSLVPMLASTGCIFDVLGDDPQEFSVTVEVPDAVVQRYDADAPGLLVLRYEIGDNTGERHLTALCGERMDALSYTESLSPTTLNCAGAGTVVAWIEPLDPATGPDCGDDFEDLYGEFVDGPPDDAPQASATVEDDCEDHGYTLTLE